MSIRSIDLGGALKPVLAAIGLATLIAAFFFVRWSFANAVASRIDLRQPESKLVVDSLLSMGPSDPLAHHAAAAIYEKTFDPGDLERSLKEYEAAAALAPNNFQAWMNLGRARHLNGDVEGAEAALKKALELAPNYSAVQWAYGNYLIREGRPDEGFQLAAKAAGASPEFARNAVALALQIFEGDTGRVIAALGEGEAATAGLAATLMAQGRLQEAFEAWSRLSGAARSVSQKRLSDDLLAKLVEAKQFRLATRVVSGTLPDGQEKPQTGQITNGGFETGIKLRGASTFDWQITEGAEPQVGQTDSQKRSGSYSLMLVFNSFESANFRTISQTVSVEPGARYRFEGFYRCDLKTTASLKIEAADAVSGNVLASSQPFTMAGDWTTMRFDVQVPGASDGIVLRLAREGCSGPACRITGRLLFDDLSLSPL